MTTKTTKDLERDLIEHARDRLGATARRHVRGGMGPESAARAAIRETQALFPPGWRLGVQGGNDEESVEVWEVEHKYEAPIAMIRAREPERPAKLTASQHDALAAMIRKTEPRSRRFPDSGTPLTRQACRARARDVLRWPLQHD